MGTRATLLLGLLLVVPVAAASAEASVARTSTDRAEERRLFRQAELALHYGQQERFRDLTRELRHYPLLPYLLRRDLGNRLDRVDDGELRLFFYRYGDTLPGERLRRQLLDRLAREGEWRRFRRFWTPDLGTRLSCHHRRALLETGETERALEGMRGLWLTAESLPDACDAALTAWEEAGRLTPALVEQRLGLAVRADELGLARYLIQRLEGDALQRSKRWLKLWKDPERVAEWLERSANASTAQLIWGLRRWARRDPAEALAAWQREGANRPYSPDQRMAVERTLAKNLAREGDPRARGLLQRLAGYAGNREPARIGLNLALQSRDWKQVLATIDALPKETAEGSRWRYWRARALEALGETEEARELYRRVAGGRGYYAFLAADRGSTTPYQLPAPEVPSTSSAITRAYPALARAFELRALQHDPDARREWDRAIARMPQEDRAAAASLAAERGWHDRALATALENGLEEPRVYYPLAHGEAVTTLTETRELDAAWVLALIRQESGFITDIRSGAGALGLMQLMPATARSVASRMDRPAPEARDLLDAETNLALGVHYLTRNARRFDHNLAVVTAAYNAGPTRVSRWLPEQGQVPTDIWVETLPYRETRRYVRRVMTATVFYEQRLGREPTPLARRLQPVAAPGFERVAQTEESASADR
ncbi:MAG: transglycosylase SLT domain-containing protein [Thiohalospira sp.]